jgi:hypothetical protein
VTAMTPRANAQTPRRSDNVLVLITVSMRPRRAAVHNLIFEA